MTSEEQIKHMAERFLAWKLPENFNPDAGVSFEPFFNVEYNAKKGKPPQRHEPSGTNLLDYTQAVAMVRYMVAGIPAMTSELRPAVAVAEDCHWEYELKSEEEAAAVIEADREAVRAEVARAIEVELSMCAIANVEAPSEWIDGFEFAWKRVKVVLEKHND